MNRTHLHGHGLAFEDTGGADREVLLLVHGLMSSHETWDGVVDRLRDRYRLIAPDLFGHGSSDKPSGDYSLGGHAASLRDLLDSLQIETVTVVGHSLGGGVAMQFAYLFPERVNRIVLVSSGGLGRELNLALRAATLPGSEFVLPVLAANGLHRIGDSLLGFWAKLPVPQISPGSLDGWKMFGTLADADTRRAFLATSRSVIGWEGQTVTARNRLSTLSDAPMLLVWGRRDTILPATHAQDAVAELPLSRLEIFDRSGHFPHLDEPDRFAAVLSAFVDADIPGQQPEGQMLQQIAE